MQKIKILCVSDIHNSNQFLSSLNKHLSSCKTSYPDYCSSGAPSTGRSENYSSRPAASASNGKYDLVLCTGDIISRPNKKAFDFLKEFINIICNLHQTKLYLVQGNNETEAMVDFLRQQNVLIHLKVKKFRGYKFFGIGGWMEDLPEISNLKSQITNAILLTHLPPKRVNPLTRQPVNPQNSPIIHLCGHLHAPGMIWRIGETLVIKIPTGMYGEAAILELPSKKVKFIKL